MNQIFLQNSSCLGNSNNNNSNNNSINNNNKNKTNILRHQVYYEHFEGPLLLLLLQLFSFISFNENHFISSALLTPGNSQKLSPLPSHSGLKSKKQCKNKQLQWHFSYRPPLWGKNSHTSRPFLPVWETGPASHTGHFSWYDSHWEWMTLITAQMAGMRDYCSERWLFWEMAAVRDGCWERWLFIK